MDKRFEKTYTFRVCGLTLVSFCYHWTWEQAVRETETTPVQIVPAKTDLKEKDGEPLFVVNSLMLHECFKQLMRTEEESLHAITGSVIGNIRSLERIIPLSLNRQSTAGASAENESLANEFIELYEFGLRPLAYFHSHPSCGIGATRPSSTDRQTQSTMEQSGSEIIGGIFSRDGFVRFYANKVKPNVRVLGKKVSNVEKNVYRLEIEENVSN
jgi:proteasome lid subunit RPN8/RPN11